jgi:hypothetical protein
MINFREEEFESILGSKKRVYNPDEAKSDFLFGLPYHRTSWAEFYQSYETKDQNQLNKRIKHQQVVQKKQKALINEDNKPDIIKACQSIFKGLEYNDVKKEFQTPQILLVTVLKKKDPNEFQILERNCTQILEAVYNQQISELGEVLKFYHERRINNEIEQKEHRLNHAKETVICSFCNAEVKRTNVSRHKKNNKECLSIQEKAKEKAEKAQQEST